MSENETVQDDLATLKARADMLGVTYHPSIGVEKLRDKINAALADKPQGSDTVTNPDPDPTTDPTPAPAVDVAPETLAQRRKRLKLEATALVRIRLTCMNPAKREWEGEIITVGNALVGTLTKFVPFNAEEGWHVPKMMYEFLKERQCQIFVAKKTKHGVTVREGKLIKEFAIEVLPPLTDRELRDLAQRQAMAAGNEE